MTEREATRALADARALWEVGGGGGATEVIAAAVDALVEGVDSPSLRELAGLSSNDSYWTLHPLMEAALEELSYPYPEVGSDDIQVAATRAMARRLMADKVTARAFAAWAHGTIGHEGADQLQTFVMFDDDYDGRAHTGLTPEAFDALVRNAAEDLLASET